MVDKKTDKPKVVPPKKKTETKHQLFLRLAKPRTEKVLKSLKILSNCSNPSYYEYSQKEVKEIFETIDKAINSAEMKFSNTKEQTTFEFS